MNLIYGALFALSGAANNGPPSPVSITVALQPMAAEGMELLAAMPIMPGNVSYVYDYSASMQAEEMEMAMSMPYAMAMGGGNYRSAKGYTMPKGVQKPLVTSIGLSDQLERYAAVLGKVGKGKERYDTLWVDWNRDRKFEDSEAIKAEASMEMKEMPGMEMGPDRAGVQCFGPVEVPPGSGRPSKICFLLEMGYFLKIVPKEVMSGELKVGEKAYKVILVDSNLDGRYDASGAGDAVLVDRNRDGKFTQSSVYAMSFAMASGGAPETEAMPLQSYVQLPDGAFYRSSVKEDGSELTFTRNPAEEGKIVGLGAKSTLGLIYEGTAIQATPTNGVVLLPAGQYRLMSATVAVPDPKGKPWTFSINDYRAKGKLEVKAGESKKLGYGLPLKLAVTAQKYGKAFNIGVELKDKSNADIGDVRKPDNQMPKEPVLTLKDARGKVLKTEKFHYG